LHSSGAKVKVNRGGSNNLAWLQARVRAILFDTMSALIPIAGEGIDVVREVDVAASSVDASAAVVLPSRSAPGKYPCF
jgi:hypothetical protein